MKNPNHRRAALLSILVFSALGTAAKANEPNKPASPTAKALFDGKSLDGWQHIGPGRFVLEDGLLKTEGGMGLLWYQKEKLGDCVLRVVYKTTRQNDNSGVYVRIAEKPDDPWYAVHHGYEVQIADAEGGSAYRVSGAVYSFAKAAARPTKPAGEWNTLEIALRGDRIQTSLNGERVADFDPAGPLPELSPRGGMGDPEPGPRPQSGYIGLQNHDGNCVVYFKEVSVRPLP
ncbi:MAG TPA: DUF1080 domain-containing protein [Pirellulales bacterium]|jgi:hypothetical protein|nr:DUF1080 domain-containing protein [Pirellulales bacterium]